MNILSRLTALENRPGNKIPRFRVEFADGSTVQTYGFGLLAVPDAVCVRYDPMNSCAQTVIDLFRALCGDGVEVVADAQH